MTLKLRISNKNVYQIRLFDLRIKHSDGLVEMTSHYVFISYEGFTESNEHIYPTMKQTYTYKNKLYQ